MFGGILNTLLKSWELLEIFASLTIISFSKCYKYKYDFYTFELIRDIPTSICIVRIAFKRNVFGYVDTYVLYSSMTSCPYTILFQPLKWPHSIDRITCRDLRGQLFVCLPAFVCDIQCFSFSSLSSFSHCANGSNHFLLLVRWRQKWMKREAVSVIGCPRRKCHLHENTQKNDGLFFFRIFWG